MTQSNKTPRNRANGKTDDAPGTKEQENATLNESFISDNPNHTFLLEEIDIHKMEVDPAIQRGLVEKEIGKIMRRYNPAAVGVVTLAAREDEDSHGRKTYRYYLLDGQQRVTAMKRLGLRQKTQAVVHYGLSLAEEARLFLDLNDRDAVGPWDRFKTACVAQDPQALEIAALLDELRIPLGPPKGFVAIHKAVSIHSNGVTGPADLRWALTFIRETYDKTDEGGCYDGRVLGAFAFLYRQLKAYIDTERLRDKLLAAGADPRDLLGRSVTIQRIYRVKPEVAIAEAIIAAYNAGTRRGGRTTKALPSVLGTHKPGQREREELANMDALDGDDLLDSPEDEASDEA